MTSRSTTCFTRPKQLLLSALVAAGIACAPTDSDPSAAAPPATAPQPVQTQPDARAPDEAPPNPPVLSATEQETAPAAEPSFSRMWWNRPKHYEAVGLEPEQRRRMNERMLLYLNEQRASSRRNEAFKAFRRAITDGDFDLARDHTEELAAASSEPVMAQALMMVDVLEMLTPEQFERLTEENAGLLSGPWLLPRNLRATPRQ